MYVKIDNNPSHGQEVLPIDSPDFLSLLVEKAKRGDHDAFSKLYVQFKQPLAALVYSRAGPQGIDDIVQETFALAFRYIQSLRDPQMFRSWLMQIGTNCCRKWLTNHKKTPQVVTDTMELEALQQFQVQQPAITPIETTDLRIDLSELLKELPDKYRQPVYMHYVEDMTMAKISRITGLPMTTVKWRIHRGLEICRLLAMKRQVEDEQLEVKSISK